MTIETVIVTKEELPLCYPDKEGSHYQFSSQIPPNVDNCHSDKGGISLPVFLLKIPPSVGMTTE